jgi:hypothetical protein
MLPEITLRAATLAVFEIVKNAYAADAAAGKQHIADRTWQPVEWLFWPMSTR